MSREMVADTNMLLMEEWVRNFHNRKTIQHLHHFLVPERRPSFVVAGQSTDVVLVVFVAVLPAKPASSATAVTWSGLAFGVPQVLALEVSSNYPSVQKSARPEWLWQLSTRQSVILAWKSVL